MSESHKLSLPTAILINVNIMLGVGIFINTAELAKRAGALGFFSYAIVGLLLLPLVISIAELVKVHPSGGFYIFARREINPFFGFLSAWVYFVGKLASSAIMIHTAILIAQELIPPFKIITPLQADGIILVLFILLNMLNMKAGSTIQTLFTVLKASSIICAIAAGAYLFTCEHIAAAHQIWAGIPSTLPLVLYAAMGFEAACALSSRIKDASKNAPRAIFISYGIVVSIIILYQLMFYGALGSQLATIASYREAFPALLQKLWSFDAISAARFGNIFNLAIAISALGGAYGILFSNAWNLYAIAQHDHMFFSRTFARFNAHAIPYLCVLTEGFICGLYLFITKGAQVPLQQTSALAAALTYTTSVIALLCAQYRGRALSIRPWIPLLGFANCLLLISFCIYGLTQKGVGSLYIFALLLAVGIIMFFLTPGKNMPEPTASSR